MEPKSILVVHLKRVGDILLSTPLLARLRRRFPRARIDFLIYAQYADVLAGNPDLSAVVAYDPARPWTLPALARAGHYDWVIDLLGNGASAWACALSGARRRVAFESRYPRFVHNLRVSKPERPMYAALQKNLLLDAALSAESLVPAEDNSRDPRPRFPVDERRREGWGSTIAATFGDAAGPLIVMSPTSRRATRKWSADGFARLARLLTERVHARVLCVWGPGEQEDAAAIVRAAANPSVKLAPPLPEIMDLAAVLSHAACSVGNCNGTRHVATAVRTPTVTIHMSSDPRVWNPPGPGGVGYHADHAVVRVEDLHCIGCQSNVCRYALECARDLSPETVLAAVEKMLSRRGYPTGARA